LDRGILRFNYKLLRLDYCRGLYSDRTELFQVGFIEGLLLFLGCSE
jgi:hypothetical protein